MNVSKKLISLIKNECANFNYDGNCCYPKDNTCCFFTDSNELQRCKYFENGVLPLDPELEFEYRKERKMDMAGFYMRENTCNRCGESFISHSNAQKYCKKCEPIMKRQKTKLRVRKSRDM